VYTEFLTTGNLEVEAAWTSKCWYPITTLHGVTTQKTLT